MPEIIKATGRDEAYLEKILDEMAQIGLIEYNWENPEHESSMYFPCLFREVPNSLI